jgi:chromosome segregation ATPase
VVIYEIVSEFLVPWIMRNKAEAGALERERRWMRGFWVAVAIGLITVLGAFVYSYRQSSEHLRAALTEADSELVDARKALQQITESDDAKLAVAQQQIRTLQDQLSKAQRDVAAQRAYISRLESLLRGAQLGLDETLAARVREVATYSRMITSQRETISTLNERATKTEADLTALRKSITDLEASQRSAKKH